MTYRASTTVGSSVHTSPQFLLGCHPVFGPGLMDFTVGPGADGPDPGIFSHISTLPTHRGRNSRISWPGPTASPVCSPSGRTKAYEIYGGVGFSGENAQIVASTAIVRGERVGGGVGRGRVGLDPRP